MSQEETLSELKTLLQKHFSTRPKEPFVPGQTPIPLITPAYGWEEVYEANLSLLSTFVTMGKKVAQFEEDFAQYVGVRHAIMVNSGSSANLLALSVLTNPLARNRIQPGDEVITPAVTWATTVYPIVNCGAVPVLVDVDLKTMNLDPREVERAIKPRTRAIMLVHLLGNPCHMPQIMDIAARHKLLVIEDACEAHGAEVDGQRVGSFGHLATFSFFFSHHITTIEGGMVLTDDEEYAELARALRTFGWIRHLKERESLAAQYPHIDPRFLFVNLGYNLRPTEIQGAFGIHQLSRLEGFIEHRRDNARYWTQQLSPYSKYLVVPNEDQGTRHVWYGYPVTVKPGAPFTREELVHWLEEHEVETRPIMAGNIEEQPAMNLVHHRKLGELPNARMIMRNSFFFGNHQGIGPQEREAVADYFRGFMARFA